MFVACRMLLSVHNKSSRLAVLGELGRFPLLVNSLIHTIKYDWHLKHRTHISSLIGQSWDFHTNLTASRRLTNICSVLIGLAKRVFNVTNVNTPPYLFLSSDYCAAGGKTTTVSIYLLLYYFHIHICICEIAYAVESN